MAETTVSDAVVFPQDQGTGVAGGNEDFNSAGYFGSLARNVDGEHVGNGLTFTNIDTTNDTFDLTSGYVFIRQSAVDVQSGANATHDTTLPDDIIVVVALPSDVTGLSLDSNAVNDVYLYFASSAQDDATVRHGSSVSEPAGPGVHLGTIDSSDGSTTRDIDYSSPELADVTFPELGGATFSGHDHSETDLTLVPNAGLTNSDVTVTAGNALSNGGTVSLGGTITVDVATDGIQTDELDLSITPTWSGEHQFNGGITGLPNPTNDTDAARKEYVDAVEQALDIKDSVRAGTDGSNVDLSSSNDPNPIDGVTLNDGDRVLLKGQSTASENGLYNAQTATDPTTWTRTENANEDSEVTSGLFVFVEEGTANANRGFVLVTADPITVDSTALDFTQFSGAGQISAGSGLNKSGDTLSFDEGYAATWTSQHRFNSGVDTRGDVVDDTTAIWNSSGGYLEQTALENDTVTVAGNTVSLGASTAVNHADLSNIGAEDHHSRIQVSDSGTAVITQPTDVNFASDLIVTDDGDGTVTIDASTSSSYTDEDAQDAVGGILSTQFTYDDATPAINLDPHENTSDVHHAKYTDSEAVSAVESGNIDFQNAVTIQADLDDGTNTIYSQTSNWIPQARLENDSVTITSGNGLKNGGSVSLGGSTTLDVEPSDFAGGLLSDDGSDNLQVNESNISHDGIDQSTVNADDHHAQDHSSRHGYNNADELSTALRYEPESEPSTPTSGVVRWYDSTEDALKAKFDDGTTATIAQK